MRLRRTQKLWRTHAMVCVRLCVTRSAQSSPIAPLSMMAPHVASSTHESFHSAPVAASHTRGSLKCVCIAAVRASMPSKLLTVCAAWSVRKVQCGGKGMSSEGVGWGGVRVQYTPERQTIAHSAEQHSSQTCGVLRR